MRSLGMIAIVVLLVAVAGCSTRSATSSAPVTVTGESGASPDRFVAQSVQPKR